MTEPNLEIGARIDALHLEPGDIVAIHCRRQITKDQAMMLTDQVKEVVGDRPVMILPRDFELMIVRYPLQDTDDQTPLAPSDTPSYTPPTTDKAN